MENIQIRLYFVRLYKEYKNSLDTRNKTCAENAIRQGWVTEYRKLEPSLDEFMYFLEHNELYPIMA